MKIKQMLILLVGFLMIVLIGEIIVNQYISNKAKKTFLELKKEIEPTLRLLENYKTTNGELSLLNNNRVSSYSYSGAMNKIKGILEVDLPYLQEQLSSLKENLNFGDSKLRIIKKIQDDTDQLKELDLKIQELLVVNADYLNEEKIKQAREILTNQISPLHLVLDHNIHELSNEYKSQFEINQSEIITNLESLSKVILVLGIIGILIGLFLSIQIIKSVLDSISKISKLASKISSGEYGKQVIIDGKNEFTTLKASLNQMSASLKTHFHEKESKLEESQQLAYIATHDLKSPMVSIEGHFNFLKDHLELGNDYVQESVGYVENGISQFHTTLAGLSEALKIKEQEVNVESIELSQLIKETLPLYEGQVKSIGGNLSMNGDLEKEIWIHGTKIYVKSILENLISNALKYHSPKRKLDLKIEIFQEKNYKFISISDNGLGIDLEFNKRRLFKMFNRFHDQSEGHGMGLYMVKTMVEKLGGSIKIESAVDVGTRFTLKFLNANEKIKRNYAY